MPKKRSVPQLAVFVILSGFLNGAGTPAPSPTTKPETPAPGMTAAVPRPATKPIATTKDELARTLEKIDKLWVGEASEADLSMEVKTSNYSRKLELRYWVKGRESTLVLITAPIKEKGTATLKLGEDLYNYLPKVRRTIKVSAALRGGSWMGSHFTNDDLIRATLLGEHYDAKLLSKKQVASKEIWEIELTAKRDAATPWGKILLEVNNTDLLPIRQRFFDEDKKLVRSILYSKIKTLGNRTIPTHVRVVPENKPGEYTEIVYRRINYGAKLEDSFFSLTRIQNLK